MIVYARWTQSTEFILQQGRCVYGHMIMLSTGFTIEPLQYPYNRPYKGTNWTEGLNSLLKAQLRH